MRTASRSLFDPGSTIASPIANEFTEASTTCTQRADRAGLLLFLITFAVLVLARLLIARVKAARSWRWMPPPVATSPARPRVRVRRSRQSQTVF